MGQAEAVAITGRITSALDTYSAKQAAADRAGAEVVELVEQAKAGKAWRVLDYPSWTAYVTDRFGGRLDRLQRADRRDLVARLAELGMSTRTIGEVVGVNASTVSRDLAAVASATPDQSVTGADGKTYARRPMFLPSGKPDAATTEDMGQSVPPVRHRRGHGHQRRTAQAEARVNDTLRHLCLAVDALIDACIQMARDGMSLLEIVGVLTQERQRLCQRIRQEFNDMGLDPRDLSAILELLCQPLDEATSVVLEAADG